jgi:hypothetical protein
MKRKPKHWISAEDFAARSAELRPILAEISGLNDAAAAATLNARGVRTLGGGKRWQGVQVTRLRRRLGLDREQTLTERVFRGVRENLGIHFGPASKIDELLIEYTAWIATGLSRLDHIVTLGDRSRLDATDIRYLKRLRALLAVLLDAMRIASDVFERRAPPQLPRAQKSGATLILESADEMLAELEAAVALKLAAVGPDVAPSAAAPAAPARDQAS